MSTTSVRRIHQPFHADENGVLITTQRRSISGAVYSSVLADGQTIVALDLGDTSLLMSIDEARRIACGLIAVADDAEAKTQPQEVAAA